MCRPLQHILNIVIQKKICYMRVQTLEHWACHQTLEAAIFSTLQKWIDQLGNLHRETALQLIAKRWFIQTSRCFFIWNYIQPCFTFWNKIKLYFTWFKILKENFLPVISGRSRTFHVGSVPVAYLTLKTIYSKQNSNNYLQPKVFPLHISHIKNYLHSKVFQKLFTSKSIPVVFISH